MVKPTQDVHAPISWTLNVTLLQKPCIANCTPAAQAYAIRWSCCPVVWLPSWTARTVDLLKAAKSAVVWIDVLSIIQSIVSIVPCQVIQMHSES